MKMFPERHISTQPYFLSLSVFSFDEMKVFELALAHHLHDMDRFAAIQTKLPNKTIADIKRAYEQLEVRQ